MKFLKTLFLFSLLVSLLTAEVHAGGKRIFGGEPKSESPPLTLEERTDRNRVTAERTESNEDETGDEEENPSKRARNEEMPHISEAPSQGASKGQATASSSSSNSAHTTAPVRFLRTNVVPTLKRFVLEKLMRLPATHPVFSEGLPLLLHFELIEPFFDKINEMIQDAHKACQRYSLYQLSSDVKEKNSLIKAKNALQKEREACQNKLFKASKRNYPNALFRIDSMTQVFPELASSIEHLKEQEDYSKQAKLALNSGQIARAGLLDAVVPLLNQQASLLFRLANGKIKLHQQLLKDSPDAEIESSQEGVAYLENRLTRTTPLIERQKIFLGRVEEFNPEQQLKLHTSFQVSHKILKDLDAASAKGDEGPLQLLLQQLNSHDQTIKALFSTDPRVQRIQEKIVYGNEKVASTASMISHVKIEQRRITSLRERRLSFLPSGEVQRRAESYAPIFDLYQIPSSFLDKEIALLQEAQIDFLAGRGQPAFQKRILATRWHDLAAERAKSVNLLSQLGMIVSPEDFLNQNEVELRDVLIAQEAQLAAQAATFPVDETMASLPWDFNKTFEENVAALSSGERQEDRR